MVVPIGEKVIWFFPVPVVSFSGLPEGGWRGTRSWGYEWFNGLGVGVGGVSLESELVIPIRCVPV